MRDEVTFSRLISDGALSLQTGPFGSQLHSYDYQDQGIPVIPTEGIQDGRIDHSVLPKITKEKAEELQRHRVRADDILFARRGAQATGRTARIRNSEEGFICGTGAIRARVEDRDVIDPAFLAWYLSSPSTVSWIREQAIGATMPNLNKSIIGRIELPSIPVSDQKSIARLLNALDDKIELNRRMSATLEEMARALYRSWFVDFDPVHARALGQPPAHMDAATTALFPDSLGPDGLPKGWEACSLSDVCTQVKRTVKPMASPDAEFQHFSLPAFDAGRMPVRELGSAIKSNKAYVPHNAILFSRLNPSIPRVWWAKTDAHDGTPAASTEFFVAASHDPVETPWLYCLLSSSDFRDEALSRVTGTSNSHQRIPPKALAEIEVIAPQPEVVEAFGTIAGPWFEKLHTMARESQTLAALRDTLLPRLMSGELRIRDAEKQVEEVV